MMPTLKPGQILMARKFDIETTKRGKLIYFHFLDKLLVKRLIGLPGDRIKIEDTTIMVNDTSIYSYSTKYEITQYYDLIIPDNNVYVIGDNPHNSLDSRRIGPIPLKDVEYQALCRIWPPKLV